MIDIKCIDKDYIVFWNDRPGILVDSDNYADEVCAAIDKKSGYYTFYNELQLSTSQEKTLLGRWFEWEDSSDDELFDTVTINTSSDPLLPTYVSLLAYNVGSTIKYYSSTRGISLNFPLPQMDLFGRCDFSSPASFYTEVDVTCQYKITDTDECTTILNPGTYAGLAVARSPDSTNNLTATTTNSSTLPTIGSDCANTMSSLKMEFYFSEISSGFLIDSVTISFDTDSHTKGVGYIVDLNVITKFYRTTATTSSHKSGNPGYLAGKRLLLADTVSGGIALTGFRKNISDSDGI